jgi:hypothetical protein
MPLPFRVGIDLDGVIIDHRPNKLRLAAEFGIPLEPWQANTNVMKSIIGAETYEAIQLPLYSHLTLEAPAVAGAIECLERLPGEAYIVSARDPDNQRFAEEWLERHGVYRLIPRERVIFCSHGREKPVHCRRLGVAAFLDDKLSFLEYLSPDIRRVLFDEDGVAPKLSLPAGLAVARSWPEFAELLERQKT